MLGKLKLLKKEELGQALIEVTLLLVVLLVFAALVIDVGYIAYQKRYLQTAVDSAALAGAMEIPKTSDDLQIKNAVVKKFVDLNNLDTSKPVTITSFNVDRGEGTVAVDITQEVPKFFSGFITSDNYSLTVHAKAKYYMDWSGEALPFVNLDDDYLADPEIVAWEKTAPGDFESIWKDDFSIFYGGKEDDHSQTYFTVDYKDGITITQGTVANIKYEVGYVYNQHKTVYIFSLSSDVIKSGTVKLVNEPYSRSLSNLKNEDIIDLSQLVLLQCHFDSYDSSGKSLTLTVNKVYDIVHDDFPEDYVNPHEKITSRLIE